MIDVTGLSVLDFHNVLKEGNSDTSEIKVMLSHLLDEAIESKNSIEDQLNVARTKKIVDGERADPDWYRRAESARRFKSRDVQRYQLMLGVLKDYERDIRAKRELEVDRCFIKAARGTLEPPQFDRIMAQARVLSGSYDKGPLGGNGKGLSTYGLSPEELDNRV